MLQRQMLHSCACAGMLQEHAGAEATAALSRQLPHQAIDVPTEDAHGLITAPSVAGSKAGSLRQLAVALAVLGV